MAQTTFIIDDSADDGYVVLNTNGTYDLHNFGGDVLVGTYGSATGGGPQYIGLLRWDTSSLPDASVISSAILRVQPIGTPGTFGSIIGDWGPWNGTSSDISAVGTTAITGVAMTSFANGVDEDISLSNANANISRTGTTYVRLGHTGATAQTIHFKHFTLYPTVCARLIVNYDTDVTPPDTTITSGPPSTTSLTSASFTFTSSEAGSTFEVRLDGGSWTSATSPKSYTGLLPGSHTFEVKATDSAGNTDPTPASQSWTIGAKGHLGGVGT